MKWEWTLDVLLAVLLVSVIYVISQLHELVGATALPGIETPGRLPPTPSFGVKPEGKVKLNSENCSSGGYRS